MTPSSPSSPCLLRHLPPPLAPPTHPKPLPWAPHAPPPPTPAPSPGTQVSRQRLLLKTPAPLVHKGAQPHCVGPGGKGLLDDAACIYQVRGAHRKRHRVTRGILKGKGNWEGRAGQNMQGSVIPHTETRRGAPRETGAGRECVNQSPHTQENRPALIRCVLCCYCSSAGTSAGGSNGGLGGVWSHPGLSCNRLLSLPEMVNSPALIRLPRAAALMDRV